MNLQEQERRALVERMLRARTLEEAQAAQKEAAAWLREHPRDATVLSAGEQLAMIEEALRVTEERQTRAS